MPLLALNRKDTPWRIGADLARLMGKRFYYGGIVAGGGITLLRLTQSWLIRPRYMPW
jgi:hypothetical protein